MVTMNNSNVLSVFIPTYNRNNTLRQAIDSVIKHWGNIFAPEIVVSDNYSNNAQIVIDSYKGIYDNISYYHNNENIGIDRNMLRFLETTSAKYCLLLGDDDYITPISTKIILNYIKEDFDFAVLNVKSHKTGFINCNSEAEKKEVFKKVYDKAPFGAVIVNKQLLENFKNDAEKYIGTSHAYSGILWDLMFSDLSTNKVLIVHEQVTIYDTVPKTWTDSWEEIHFKQIPHWYKLLPKALSSQSNVMIDNFYLNDIPFHMLNQMYHRYKGNLDLINKHVPKILENKISIVVKINNITKGNKFFNKVLLKLGYLFFKYTKSHK